MVNEKIEPNNCSPVIFVEEERKLILNFQGNFLFFDLLVNFIVNRVIEVN